MPDETNITSSNIQLVLTSTFGADEWEVRLPTDRAVQVLVARLLREPQFGFREADDGGNPIPYRILWKEGSRILTESETLAGAGVKEGHTLVMTHEARAGFPAHFVRVHLF